MDDSTRKFIAHLPIPQRVSVKRAAEILDDSDAAHELLDLVAHGHLFSWTHCPSSGDIYTRDNHSLGKHIELQHITADTDTAKVFIEGSEVQWRWCVHYESRLQLVELPEKSTVEVRERIVLEHARTVAITPSPGDVETTMERRARWLAEFGEGERGAVQRVFKNELLRNPKADRSFIGKEIGKARREKAQAKQGDFMFVQLVQDGKRTS